MLSADLMMLAFLAVSVFFALPGVWLLSRGLYPLDVEAMAADLERGRVRSFFMGLPVTVVCVLGLAICADKHQPFTDLSALLFLVFFLFYSNVGVSALASMIGRKLPSPADREMPWKCIIRGGIVLELSYLFPVLGWFFILPISLIVGTGAVTSRLIARGKFGMKDSGPTGSAATSAAYCPASSGDDADQVVDAAG